jgi:hypothetical protein
MEEVRNVHKILENQNGRDLLNALGVDEMVILKCKKVKISLLQAVKAPRVPRGQGSHIT